MEHISAYQKCVHPKEKRYFIVASILASIVWISLILFTFGFGLLYVLILFLSLIVAHAFFIAHVRGYGIRISSEQFPELYTHLETSSRKLAIDIPEAYIYNMDGIFNAFATHFFSRNFIILSANLVNSCYGDDAKLEFIIAHEMVHLQRGHTRSMSYLLPVRFFPWIGNAYSKACEYTCDAVAGHFIMKEKESAIQALLLLATADIKRSEKVDIGAYMKQRESSGSFFMTLTETNATHPYSFHRVAALLKLYGEDIQPIKKSFAGILCAPFLNWKFVIILYLLIYILGSVWIEGSVMRKLLEKTTLGITTGTFPKEFMEESDTTKTPLILENGKQRIYSNYAYYSVDIPPSFQADYADENAQYADLYFKDPSEIVFASYYAHKDDFSASSLEKYPYEAATFFDEQNIEVLEKNNISNPFGFNVADFKVTGTYEGKNMVLFLRVIEMDDFYLELTLFGEEKNLGKLEKQYGEILSSFIYSH